MLWIILFAIWYLFGQIGLLLTGLYFEPLSLGKIMRLIFFPFLGFILFIIIIYAIEKREI